MIKGVGQGYNPIYSQGLGGPRPTVGTRQGASIFRKALESEMEQASLPIEPQVQQQRPQASAEPIANNMPRQAPSQGRTQPQPVPMDRMLDEVTNLANDVGYVGFTKDDILRAYHTGESFFVDYTV